MTLVKRDYGLDNLINNFLNQDVEYNYSPAYNIIENEKGYELSFELPGIVQNDVSVEVKDRELKIEVSKKDSSNDKEEVKYLVKNRSSKEFKKIFKLPEDVDQDSISADMKNGILTLSISKRDEVMPKKITING